MSKYSLVTVPAGMMRVVVGVVVRVGVRVVVGVRVGMGVGERVWLGGRGGSQL